MTSISGFSEYATYLRGRHEGNPYFIYLDQNILIDICEDKYTFSNNKKDVYWIYSGETLNEIRRSGNLAPLEVLKELSARKIEFIFDNDNITESANILKLIDPYEVYEDYIVRSEENECSYGNDQLNYILVAFLFGADNYSDIENLPDDLLMHIESLAGPIDDLDDDTFQDISNTLDKLQGFTSELSNKKRDSEYFRKSLGMGKNGAGDIDEIDTITEIWNRIKGRLPDSLSCDNFFMFDPPSIEAFEAWSVVQGIVSSYLILSRLGYKPDKGITNPNTLKNIISDSWHVGYGAYCDGIISRDNRQLAKAQAIYKHKKINSVAITATLKK